MSNDLTTSTTFSPTPAMRVWLDVSIETHSDNVSEIALKCNVTRQAWYQWLKDEKFCDWYESEWKERIGIFRWKLDLIGLKRAECDFRYWDAMQKRIDGISREKNKNKSSEMVIRFVDASGADMGDSHDS